MTIQYRGENLPISDWSATGCLVFASALTKDEALTLLIPCENGDFTLETPFDIIRQEDEETAVKFAFRKPSDAAILAVHARNIGLGHPTRKEDLLKAANPVMMEAKAQDPTEPSRFRIGRFIPFLLTVLVILLLAFIIVPHIRSQVTMKVGEQARFVTLATNRLEAAKIQQNALVRKKERAENVIKETPIPLTSEQLALFHLGIEQIEGEIRLQDVNIQMLEANLAEVKKGNFFYEKEALAPFSTQFHVDSAPFLTQLLAEIADESRLYPKTEEDQKSYQQVARQRYENALAELSANVTKLEMLGEIEKRYLRLSKQGAISQTSLLFLERDRKLLNIDQARLETTKDLLLENWKNTLKGNFTLETRLLEKFNPAPRSSPPTVNDYPNR